MPNWCSNTMMVSHKDTAMITRAAEAIKRGGLFEEFVPLNVWDYNQAVAKWGTKWDASNLEIIDRYENSVSASFDTAWCPPMNFYDELLAQGFEVHASYFEPGMGFVGRYMDGEEEEYEIDPDDLSNIPEDLNEAWGIADMFGDWGED